MAADDHHGAIQGDVGSVVDGHQACGHIGVSWAETFDEVSIYIARQYLIQHYRAANSTESRKILFQNIGRHHFHGLPAPELAFKERATVT